MLEDGSGFIHPEASLFTFFFFFEKNIYLFSCTRIFDLQCGHVGYLVA